VPSYKALIAGATGAVGGALATELASSERWRVLGLSRRTPAAPVAGVEYVQHDMSVPGDCQAMVDAHPDITHLFYCGRATHGEVVIESAGENLALLANLVDALEAGAPGFDHAHLVQGGKVYGVHLGPFPTPASEDQLRVPVQNFNYDQEDLLRRRSAQAGWSWSASRPNTLLHFSPGNGRNLVSSLGAYAAICRELGAALDFPGPQGAFQSLTQVTSTDLLCRAMAWMAVEPGARDQAFNVTNGDVFRWIGLWPWLATAFGIPAGSVRPLRLAQIMHDKEPVWARIRARHGLVDLPLDAVANWPYLDATLERTWDELLSTNKLRTHGFHDWADTPKTFELLLDTYRDAKLLP
jgi:nucleoside-diphosphate-sugar epimerase